MIDANISDKKLQGLVTATGEILEDIRKSGKKRDWKGYKLKSLAIAEAYRSFQELEKYADRIGGCGSWLRFEVCMHGHYKCLVKAIFCYCRLCVMCQWRRSLVIFFQLIELIHAHVGIYKTDVPMLLTLTVPNVLVDGLKARIDLMQVAWKRLSERKLFCKSIRGWFRALEVTYNEERGDYHPHFHVLLMVPKNYFYKKSGLYIERDEWLEMWRKSTKMPEITQVDIRTVKKRSKKDAIASVAAEVGKYATKPSSYLEKLSNGEYKADPKVIEALHYALRNRRLVAFGGLLKKLKKELKLKDIEQADLVKITEEDKACRCPICQSTLIEEVYRWRLGIQQYVG